MTRTELLRAAVKRSEKLEPDEWHYGNELGWSYDMLG